VPNTAGGGKTYIESSIFLKLSCTLAGVINTGQREERASPVPVFLKIA